MNTLALDLEEVDHEHQRRWVRGHRRAHGIRHDEATCWFVDVETKDLETGKEDRDTKWLGSSPGDALDFAESLGCNAAHRDGTGRWTLEVFGDGVNAPTILRVYPRLDEQQP